MPRGQRSRRQNRLTHTGRAGLLAQSYGFGEGRLSGSNAPDQADARAGSCQESSASASANVT